MSGSSGEKTELPTPKKQRDAREQGQVPRSQEVVSAASLLAVVGYIWATWGDTNKAMVELIDQIAGLPVAAARDGFAPAAQAGILAAARTALHVMLPVLGITIVVGIASNMLQFGVLFSLKSVTPSLEKVSPGSGFKKIFSMKQVIEILKSILKIVVLSVLMYIVLVDAIGPFTASVACGLECQGVLTSSFLNQTLVYSALAFAVVAAADLMYQRHSHTKSLMMSKDEVKREYKESEGDPHIKGKRKQIAQEMAMGEGGQAARKGTAVVVNPTHFAVVLYYDAEETKLPLVTAKGRNMQAAFLRAEAESAGVPIFRNVQLARALYADAELNGFVPDELFDAVAEVLAWVTRNRDRLYTGRLPHGDIDMEAGDHRVVH